MNGAMKFIDPESKRSLAEGSITDRIAVIADSVRAKFHGHQLAGIFESSVVLIKDDKAARVPIMESGDGLDFGPPEALDLKVYDSEAEWAADQAAAIAKMIGEGTDTCNRLHALVESVSRGNAYTAESLLRRMQSNLTERRTWADVYSTREREIRKYIHGEIGQLRESIPSTRFRVLATEHAPKDPERYREDLIESFEKVLSLYDSTVSQLSEVDGTAASTFESFVGLEEGMLLQNLTGFVSSLRESADGVSRDGSKFLQLESKTGDIARLSRLHDLLAEGLEDYLICATFARKIVTDITSSGETKL